MLSKSSTLLLGIIAESPINPYEITKLTDYLSGGNWLSPAPSSIYATIKTLQDKGYITGENVKAGNMPEKTVYTITEAGKEQLLPAIEGFLGDLECDYAKFNISIILICHLAKDRALQILQDKVIKLDQKTKAVQAKLDKLSTTLPPTAQHGMRHLVYLTNAEIQSTKELIQIIEADNEWNHFFVKDTKERKRGTTNDKLK